MQVNRKDIGYTIYSRLEDAVRSWVADCLLSFGDSWLDHVPPGVLDKVRDRSSLVAIDMTQDPLDLLDETDMPDLAEVVCYRNSFTSFVPHGEFTQSEFQEAMASIYQLRNKIAHVRRSFTALDLDLLVDMADRLLPILGIHGAELNDTLDCIKERPESVVIQIPNDFLLHEVAAACLHNLPPSDYEPDGGFIGRKEDFKKLKALVLSDLDRVITISGAGGVGKTALAHKFCSSLLENSPTPFDALVWISAKEEKLTLTGIAPIEPMIRNYDEMIDRVLEVFGMDCYGDDLTHREEAIELILTATDKGFLLVVDNLETIRDERIIEFIKNIPRPNKVLITSRMGLGEVERRYQLRELPRSDAIALIRALAKEKGIDSLVRLPDTVLYNYAQKMSSYPLVIKWVVGQVALGKDMDQLVTNVSTISGDIARFCFDHIYDNLLSEDARVVLCSLAASDLPMTRGVLTHVSGLKKEQLDQALQDLSRASLVIPQQEKGENDSIITKYALLTLTLAYLRDRLQQNTILWRKIKERMQAATATLEEAEKAGRQYRYALQDLGAITDEEKIASTWASTAHQRIQMSDYEGAVEAFKRATEIAPKFARIYRNWSVVECDMGYYQRANELMEKASTLAPDDPTIWFTWGQMEKRRNRLDSAERHFKTALALSPDDGAVFSAMGDVARRKGQFEKAEQLFREALKFPPSDARSRRHEIITRTAIADTLRRWSEHLVDIRKDEIAIIKAREAYFEATQVVNSQGSDERSRETLQKVAFLLAKLVDKSEGVDAALPYYQQAIVKYSPKAKVKNVSSWACYHLAESLVKEGRLEEADDYLRVGRKMVAPRFSSLLRRYDSLRDELSAQKPVGRISYVDELRGFGFIETGSMQETSIFVHISQIVPRVSNREFKLMEGVRVQFEIMQTEKGPQANNVIMLGEHGRTAY